MDSNKTKVIILTRDFRVEGEIDLLPGARLTDFMNGAKGFIVVTSAKVSTPGGDGIVEGEFINVHVRNIEVILPADKAL